jgi:hypothetical protein
MNKIDKKLVEQVVNNETQDIDLKLHALGKEYDNFVVINPMYDPWILDYLDVNQYSSDKCIVWHIDNTWIAKKFTSSWTTEQGWQLIECELDLDTEIEYNPELSFLKFDVNKTIPFNDIAYTYVYYLNPEVYLGNDRIKFNLSEDKTWVAKVKCTEIKIIGEKDAGKVSPSSSLPQLIKNPDIPDIDFEFVDNAIPYYDAVYDRVWYLDQNYNNTEDRIWVYKIPAQYPSLGEKDMGNLVPVKSSMPELIFNKDIPNLDLDFDFSVSFYDLKYENVWYLNDQLHYDDDKIWAAKLVPKKSIAGTRIAGDISLHTDKFDVIFISYNEPNAEANWQRVLEKAPYAKRVKGVKGIFEAHKRAAELAKTKMFYVVDGDAELDDSWEFNFKVNVFDTDCVHLWTSLNPINDLEYGYGGVKLFPRQLLLDAKTWKVDLTTGLGKLKLINRISNITAFNYDEFTTWRSAFRECAKLSSSLKIEGGGDSETKKRLKIWTTVGQDRHMGEFAIAGAVQGKKYGNENYNDPDKLKLVNDYEWLRNRFDKQFEKAKNKLS